MNNPTLDPSWPESWQMSHAYDQLELGGKSRHSGYSYAYKSGAQTTFDLIEEAVPTHCSVLDVAAGQGNFSLRLAELGYDVTWNDLREDLVDYVRLKHEHGSIDYLPGDIFTLGGGRRRGIVLLTEVLEHAAHPDQLLNKVASLVKPGGAIVATTPNGAYFRNRLPQFSDCSDLSQYETTQYRPDADGHIFLLHPQELTSLATASGLEVTETRLFTNPLTNGHVKSEALLRRLPENWVWQLERRTRNLPKSLLQRLHTGMAVLLRPHSKE